MLFHRVSLLTLGLVFSLSLQAQIIILPDNSTPVSDTPDDSANQVTPATPASKKPPPSNVTIIKTKNTVQVVNPRNKTEPAQSVASEEKKPAPARNKTNRDSLVLGLNFRMYKYEEPDFVTHQGLMYGNTAQYLMVFQSGELNLNTELLYGSLKYDGSITESDGMGGSTTRPISVTNIDFFNKTNAIWQWTPVGPGSPFALKIGLGYRYLSDNYTDRGFYQRNGFWVYVPVGLGIRSNYSPMTQFTLDLTYQHIVYGGIDSKLSETGISGLEDVYLKQNGHGLEVEAGMIYDKTYHLSVYFEGWYLDDSDIVDAPALGAGSTLQEPANSAISYGVKLGYDLF